MSAEWRVSAILPAVIVVNHAQSIVADLFEQFLHTHEDCQFSCGKRYTSLQRVMAVVRFQKDSMEYKYVETICRGINTLGYEPGNLMYYILQHQ